MKPSSVIANAAKQSIPRWLRSNAGWIASSALPPRNDRKQKSQSGNAVMFILIGIALFGALVYTFMKGSQQGQGNLTEQQSRIAAQDMINYANTIRSTIDKLRQRGCSESEINFYNTTYKFMDNSNASANNTNAPADGSCNVFHTAGGNLQPVTFPNAYQGDTGGGSLQSVSMMQADINGVGTSANDVILVIPHIKRDICTKINETFGIPLVTGNVPPYVTTVWPAQYSGTFTASVQIGYSASSTVLSGKNNFCVAQGTAPANIWAHMYYTVLLAR